MARGLKEGEPSGRDVYGDIIDHPHWRSPVRPPMSLQDRAAQFSPYQALTGYSDMVREDQRLTEEQILPGESDLHELDRKLSLLARAAEEGLRPYLTFTVFVPDARKAGGAYEEISGCLRRVDPVRRQLLLVSGEGPGKTEMSIDLDRILAIRGDLIDE